jgi:hypothetical protein
VLLGDDVVDLKGCVVEVLRGRVARPESSKGVSSGSTPFEDSGCAIHLSSGIAMQVYSEGKRAEAATTLSDRTIRVRFGASEKPGGHWLRNKGKETEMAFGTFKSLGEVALRYQIALHQVRFLQPSPHPVNEQFQKRLEFYRENAPVSASEARSSANE